MGKEFAPPEFLIVGHVLATWGTRGEAKVRVLTEFPERFEPGEAVFVDGRRFEIESSRRHKQYLLVKLASIDSVEDAEKLRGRDLTIPRSLVRPLPPDQYYVFQIIGLDVVTLDGETKGHIVDIMTTAGSDVYVVDGERGEILIPAIEDVVKSIDLEKGRVVIDAIDGLLPSP